LFKSIKKNSDDYVTELTPLITKGVAKRREVTYVPDSIPALRSLPQRERLVSSVGLEYKGTSKYRSLKALEKRPAKSKRCIGRKCVQDHLWHAAIGTGVSTTIGTGIALHSNVLEPLSDRWHEDWAKEDLNPSQQRTIKILDAFTNPTPHVHGGVDSLPSQARIDRMEQTRLARLRGRPGGYPRSGTKRPPEALTTPSKRTRSQSNVTPDKMPAPMDTSTSTSTTSTSAKAKAVNYSRVAFRTPTHSRRSRYAGRRRQARARRSLVPKLHYNRNCMYFTASELNTDHLHVIHLSNPGTGIDYSGQMPLGDGQPSGDPAVPSIKAGTKFSNGAQYFYVEPKINADSFPGGQATFMKYALPTSTNKIIDKNLLEYSAATPRFCMRTDENLNQPSPEGIFLKSIAISGLIRGAASNAHFHICIVRQKKTFNPHSSNTNWGARPQIASNNPFYGGKYSNNTLPEAALDFCQLAWPNSTNRIDTSLYEVLGESYITLDSKYITSQQSLVTAPTTNQERAFQLNIPINRKITPITNMFDQVKGTNFLADADTDPQVTKAEKAYNYDNIYPTQNIWMIVQTDHTPASKTDPADKVFMDLSYSHVWMDPKVTHHK